MNSVRKEFQAAQSAALREDVKKDSDRLRYHLMPPVGWLNDPNGLCEYKGNYHIFYQYTPGEPNGHDHRGWGHYVTKDFINYEELDDTFVPDSVADGKGSYSGSALIRDGKMHLFFTGNNKIPGDYDYINEGRTHWVLHSESEDGKHFTEKEVLLKNADYPEYLSCHVRDPKLIEENGKTYMVLGARTKDSEGQVEVFESENLKDWKHASTIKPEKPFGYMFECPDLFDLDEHRILITCPQGVKTEGINYENIYQNGWFEVKGPLDKDQSVWPFTELDYGFDFYAPQSFEDEKGRRILIGWMGIPDADYTNPTIEKNWQHALTLPRVLSWKNNSIYQQPIEELKELREEEISFDLKAGECIELPSRVMELDLAVEDKDFSIDLRGDVKLTYDKAEEVFALHLGKSGYGRDVRHVKIADLHRIQIFSDTSSLEIFLNDGEKVLSTRLYDQESDRKLCSSIPLSGKAWSLSGFKIEEKLDKEDPTI